MRKTIIVDYNLYGTEQYIRVPVSYQIETEGQREVYKCSVDAKGEKIPEWLTVMDFKIPTVHRPGISVTMFSEVKDATSIDAKLFVQQVYESILAKESAEDLR